MVDEIQRLSRYGALIITVLIPWLNLHGVRIDTCLFEGMDTYWKTLLLLAFPAYVIFLVVVVILISEHFVRFAQLIGWKKSCGNTCYTHLAFLHQATKLQRFHFHLKIS